MDSSSTLSVKYGESTTVPNLNGFSIIPIFFVPIIFAIRCKDSSFIGNMLIIENKIAIQFLVRTPFSPISWKDNMLFPWFYFLICTAPIKSWLAIAERSPKKSSSSIFNLRQMTLRLAPSGNILVKKGNKYSDW